MTLTLREYQKPIFDQTIQAISEGKNPLCCLPCRSGKSYIMAALCEHFSDKNILIMAHRRELLRQHILLFKELNLTGSNIRFVSVFTEVRRINTTPDTPKPDIIIIDEAHLSEAASYRKVCEHYGCSRILFTATPARLDGKPLTLANELIQGVSVRDLINLGAVSDYTYYAPDLGLDFSEIKLIAGEYSNQELTDLMTKSRIYGDVLKYYGELAENKQAIAYCVSVKHSLAVCEAFNQAGIPAVHIDGGMTDKKRDAAMAEFVAGNAKILCNCNIISEGITLPSAEVCLMLRPTQSLPLFIQQASRVLTPKPDKRAIVIDFVGNFYRHGLLDEEREWSLEAPVKRRRELNDSGEFIIRQCPNCYQVFPVSPVCPWCGFEYPVKPREIKAMEAVRLKQIEAEEAAQLAELRKQKRQEVGRARTLDDLKKIAKARGYNQKWVHIQAKLKGIRK